MENTSPAQEVGQIQWLSRPAVPQPGSSTADLPLDLALIAGFAEEGDGLVDADADLRHADAAGRIAILRQRLGIPTPPAYRTMELPLERLVIIDEVHLNRRGRSFSVNFGLVGMLHPPAVVPLPGTDTFRVVTGRGRVAGARQLGSPAKLECHCYEHLTRTEEALLVLSENMRRTPAWVQEVEALAQLSADGVGLTEEELAYLFGLSTATVRERLKLAQLSPVIREQIVGGQLTQATAKRLTRLTPTERAVLERHAEDGEIITDDLVRQALHGQIAQGMNPVRQALASGSAWSPWAAATTWEEAAQLQEQQPAQAADDLGHQNARSTPTVVALREDGSGRVGHIDVGTFLRNLDSLALVLHGQPGTARACALAQALVQELQVLRVPTTIVSTPSDE